MRALSFGMIVSVSFSCLAIGCSRKEPPASMNDGSTSISSSSSGGAGGGSWMEAGLANKADGDAPFSAAAPKTVAEVVKDAKPPISGEMDEPVVRLKTDKGKLVVWSGADGEMSLILAGYESKPGELTGPAKLLRRTSGKVGAIDVVGVGVGPIPSSSTSTDGGVDAGAGAAAASFEDVAVAWASSLGESKGGQLIALVFASVDLARVTAPTTLGIVVAPIALQGHVGLVRNPKGGGVIVAHQGPTVSCTLMDQPTECVSFDVKSVSPAGKVDKLGGTKLHGGPSPEYFFVDLDGRGLVVYGSSMRGGRTIEPVVVPYVAGDPAPTIDPPKCDGLSGYAPEFRRGTKGEIVALCMNFRPEKEACAKPTHDDPNRCPSIAITGSDGKPITPKGKDLNALRIECVDGKQKITSPGGDVTLVTSSALLADFTKSRCGP